MIDDKLNLVLDVTDNIKVFHTPISVETFEANFRILAAANSSLFSHGAHYAYANGPRIAALTLKDEGKKEAESRMEEGDFGASALLAEIKRLTLIVKPSASGWEPVPVDGSGLDADEWKELESQIVFFTCLVSLAAKRQRKEIASGVASALKGSIVSSSLSEWTASLPVLTKPASGPKRSSVAC